jgi:hypothetical protein
VWSYTSTPPNAFLACTEVALPLTSLLSAASVCCSFRNHVFFFTIMKGRDSSVGTANRYKMDGRESNTGWGEIFRSRPDRPWGWPNLLYEASWVPLPGVKRPGRGADHPPPSSAEVKERVDLYLYSPPLWAFMACSRASFAVYLYFHVLLQPDLWIYAPRNKTVGDNESGISVEHT